MKMSGIINIGAAALVLAAASITGCASGFFSGQSAPNSAQLAAYNVQTNYVTKVTEATNVVEQTNTVTASVTETNTVTVTNTLNQVVTVPEVQVVTETNVVVVPSVQVFTVTNVVPQYSYTPNADSAAAAAAAGAVVNGFVPGAGTLTTTGLVGLLGFMGWLMSAKKGGAQGTAASAMAQEMETLLEFIGQLPNGAAYTTQITAWLQSHQVQAGAADTILTTLESQVSNPDAKAAVATILASLNAVNASTVTSAQVQAAQAAAANAK